MNVPIIYTLCMILFSVGIYGIVTKKNVVKIILSILIMENALNLFILMIGYRKDGIAPIVQPGMDAAGFAASSVDPLTQAMVLTSIVIGLSMIALMVAIAIRLYERFGTFDISEIKDLKE
ncbi:MAG: NADH-quinone oxidoreductase subunit K [Elusimicrobia bacterium]|nr:NADH-quinone oxidoreductase subunit K [Elusimicrobiota bacterium]